LVERGVKVNPPLADQNSGTPLEAACRFGHAEMAEWLLEQGAIIYVERTQLAPVGGLKFEPKTFASPTALYCAVRSGSIATIQVLVRHGARLDTSEIEAELGRLGFGHDTLLHKAIEANHPHVVEFLVKSGLSLEAPDSLGFTPLIKAANLAARSDRKKIIEQLLALGADPNATDKDGYTALDMVSDSNAEVAKLIRRHRGKMGKDIAK